MFGNSSNSREFGRAVALSQVGFEMVAPIVLGLILDHYLDWTPWGLVGGALLGLCGGLAHLVHLLGKEDAQSSSPGGPKETKNP
jgi:F0F1-type ATP synthase assembly protein I